MLKAVKTAINALVPGYLELFVFILSSDELFKNEMEKIPLIMDKMLENLDYLKEAFYSKG